MGMDGNGWEWWEWWEWDDKCGLKKGHWCGKLMHKIPGSLQRELETSRNVDDGWPWKKRRLSAEDWWTFPMGFPRFRVPQRSWLERLAAIASHGLDEFPETSDGNGEKLGGFRFQYVQGSIGWLRMQVDAASDDFFNTDHSMFWCLAIILRCFQPPSWMSFTWPSNCERSATLWRKSLEWTTLLTNLGTKNGLSIHGGSFVFYLNFPHFKPQYVVKCCKYV
jgi:hypothetical protein